MKRCPSWVVACTLAWAVPAAAQDAASPPDQTEAERVKYDVEVTAVAPRTAASSSVLRSEMFSQLFLESPAEVLRAVPGLVISQHAGGGKSDQYLIRGFDADHGTDVLLAVDGVPVNMVSHAHGQGYADLHFLIPETVERFDVHKGPYYAEFGNLATAGAVPRLTVNTAVVLADWHGWSGQLRVRHVGDHPAVEDGSVDALGFTVADMHARRRLSSNWDALLSVENAFDVRYREAQTFFGSRLPHESAPVDDVHFTPGNPRAFRIGLEYRFDWR